MIQIKDITNRKISSICDDYYCNIKKPVIAAIKKHIDKKRADFILGRIESIIKGKPNELLNILKSYKKFCKKNKTRAWSSQLDKAFSYDNFLNRKYNPYTLAGQLNIKVCTYCNRQYTFTIIKNKKNITRPEFDHFFSQIDFPLFALSFYNLIPCCHICNATLKHDKKFNLKTNIHPYLEGFGKACKFSYKPLSTLAGNGLSSEYKIELRIKGNQSLKNRITGNIKTFKLNEIYENHADLVQEVVRKYFISGGNYLVRLKAMFSSHLNNLEELYQIAFGNYFKESDYEKRTMAKFVKDIFDETSFANP